MNRPVSDWRGRRVWIFGASSGIGAALARELLARGARVAVSARRADRLRDLAESSGQALAIPCDAADAAAVAAAADAIRAAWGGIDSAFYVAGDYVPMRAWAIDLTAAERMIAANLSGAVTFAAAVLPHLLADEQDSGEGGGDIAFVASVAGYRGLPKALVYGPTKAALINLAESLYLDLRPEGVGVYLVSPGYVDTPATAGNAYRMPALISAREAAESTLAGIAAGRFEIHYPRRFTVWLKFARLLPYRLYFALVRRVTGL